jgi:hypothetical protein|nr:MAG TPA: hypothetical protein [Caudoviricetes sp.]
MEQNKPDRRIVIVQTIKLLFFAFALIVAYLFALNGRYTKIDDVLFFDKWKKTIVEISKYEEMK